MTVQQGRFAFLFCTLAASGVAADDPVWLGDWEQCSAESAAWTLIRIQPYEYGQMYSFDASGAVSRTVAFTWTQQSDGYELEPIGEAGADAGPVRYAVKLDGRDEQLALYLNGEEQPFFRARDRCLR